MAKLCFVNLIKNKNSFLLDPLGKFSFDRHYKWMDDFLSLCLGFATSPWGRQGKGQKEIKTSTHKKIDAL